MGGSEEEVGSELLALLLDMAGLYEALRANKLGDDVFLDVKDSKLLVVSALLGLNPPEKDDRRAYRDVMAGLVGVDAAEASDAADAATDAAVLSLFALAEEGRGPGTALRGRANDGTLAAGSPSPPAPGAKLADSTGNDTPNAGRAACGASRGIACGAAPC